MGKRGPSKQPEALAKIKGTHRPSRYGEKDLDLTDYINEDSGYPDPPETLEEFGRRVWIQIMQKACRMGNWIAWDDLVSLEMYCAAVDDFKRTVNAPRFDVLKDGRKVVSADYKVYKDCIMVIDRLSQRYGLDPSAKSAFTFGVDDKKEDDFSEWRV